MINFEYIYYQGIIESKNNDYVSDSQFGFHFEGYSSMTDLMFGMRQRDSGITSYPIRNRQRVISYAITIALREYKPQ